MPVLIVIPARFASTRYPGKPLVELRGASGQPRSLIRRSWDAACRVTGADRIVVATDDTRIEAAATGFGAEVVMTPETCRNGTERCGAVLERLQGDFDIVINLQGDAPLTPPWFVEALIAEMQARPDCQVATPVLRCGAEALAGLKEDRRQGRVGATTAVFDHAGDALYFSKEVLPFIGRDLEPGEVIPVFHHVGVYAYRPHALRAYSELPIGALEHWEGLEQLRFMENGIRVACVEVEGRGHAFWEVNNPSDVERVELYLRALSLE
jgi:3-deoxy-manno-octulosonate cytidylyltransferase (CMP-KDO synthetase)